MSKRRKVGGAPRRKVRERARYKGGGWIRLPDVLVVTVTCDDPECQGRCIASESLRAS